MSAITKGNSPYSKTTQSNIRALWNNQRTAQNTAQQQTKQGQIDRNQQTSQTINKIITEGPATIGKGARRKTQSSELEKARIIREIAEVGAYISRWINSNTGLVKLGYPLAELKRYKKILRDKEEELQALQIKLVKHIQLYV